VSGSLETWGRYHALIIGINKYKEWPRLQTAVKDAVVLKKLLISRYGFHEQDVILRTDGNATRNQIIRDLRYLATSMEKSDNLLIYYAGHGQLDDLTGDGYWVPVEGGLKFPASWISNSLIKNVLSSNRVLAKNVVVIADSCYSGSMLRGGPSLMSLDDRRYIKKLRKQASRRSRQVISSGGVEPVADGGADGHSLFAYYLLDALRTNDREVIDLENLFHTRVWKPVTEIGDQRPNVGRLKTPMDQDGQFVLYNVAWVKEQARHQAARQAEQEARAKRQSAVTTAELELQRQRMEIEKQKLALEKEQLARQKALEIERLQFEKQKQAFEYAKLKARLAELEAQKNTKAVLPASSPKLKNTVKAAPAKTDSPLPKAAGLSASAALTPKKPDSRAGVPAVTAVQTSSSKKASVKKPVPKPTVTKQDSPPAAKPKKKIDRSPVKTTTVKRKPAKKELLTASLSPAATKPKVAKPDAKVLVPAAGVAAVEGPYSRYTNGIVYDKNTNLEWYAGPDRDTNWHDADKWVKKLDLAGGGWRMPRIKELKTLYQRGKGKLNRTALFQVTGPNVWSKERHSGSATKSSTFSFSSGGEVYFYRSNSTRIRVFAVRTRKNQMAGDASGGEKSILQASISPAVVSPSKTQVNIAEGSTYRLAIFPFKMYALQWGTGYLKQLEIDGLKGIAAALAENENVALKYSYTDISDIVADVAVIDEVSNEGAVDDVWKKELMFAKYEPDWAMVKQLGAKIDAPLVVLIRSVIGKGTQVYLYDVESDKMYSKKFSGSLYAFKPSVKNTLHNLLEDFIGRQ